MTTPSNVNDADGGDYLSASEAAALVGVHRDTMRRWTDNGLVPSVRTPTGYRRIRRADVLSLLTAPRR